VIEVVRQRLRLATIYELTKLVSAFRGVEETGLEVTRLMNESLPLASAILLEARSGDLRMIVWHNDAALPDALLRAETNARASYGFLAGPVPSRAAPMDVHRVPVPFGRRPQPPLAPDDGLRRSFMTLPLAVEHGAIFGAFQVEGAFALEEDDLAFVDAAVSLMAMGIDRHHALRRLITS
jgi:hypothetical protein